VFFGGSLESAVAAHLSLGILPHEFGPLVSDYEKLKDLEPQKEKDEIVGKILSIDRFGNAITNLKLSVLQEQFPDLRFSAQIGEKNLREIKSHYAEAESKEPFLLFGSTRLLEISVNQGSAAKVLKIKKGDPVRIRTS
jgi:S-adenosylmethionine hydrolase